MVWPTVLKLCKNVLKWFCVFSGSFFLPVLLLLLYLIPVEPSLILLSSLISNVLLVLQENIVQLLLTKVSASDHLTFFVKIFWNIKFWHELFLEDVYLFIVFLLKQFLLLWYKIWVNNEKLCLYLHDQLTWDSQKFYLSWIGQRIMTKSLYI